MDRRQVLKLGAALTALPLTGCGAGTPTTMPEPVPAEKTPPGASNMVAADPPSAPAASAEGAPAPENKNPDPPAAMAAEAPPKAPFTRVVGRLGRNHGHELTVSFADVTQGAEKTYQLGGTSKHTHAVTLTADDMKLLLSGKILRTKSTSDGGHAHRVVARCAPPTDPPEWINVCKFSSSGRDEHEIVITADDMSAKVQKTYDIQGLAGHPHEVTLTPEHFEKLIKGAPVTMQCSREPNDAHLHTVTIEYRVKKKA